MASSPVRARVTGADLSSSYWGAGQQMSQEKSVYGGSDARQWECEINATGLQVIAPTFSGPAPSQQSPIHKPGSMRPANEAPPAYRSRGLVVGAYALSGLPDYSGAFDQLAAHLHTADRTTDGRLLPNDIFRASQSIRIPLDDSAIGQAALAAALSPPARTRIHARECRRASLRRRSSAACPTAWAAWASRRSWTRCAASTCPRPSAPRRTSTGAYGTRRAASPRAVFASRRALTRVLLVAQAGSPPRGREPRRLTDYRHSPLPSHACQAAHAEPASTRILLPPPSRSALTPTRAPPLTQLRPTAPQAQGV